MIKSEKEYLATVRQLEQHKILIEKKRKALREEYSLEEINRAIEPICSFYQQWEEEVLQYERAKRGDIGTINNLSQIGRLLIGLRIAKGVTHAELGKQLGVSEAQILRDERNEYHGISISRAQEIARIFNAHFNLKVFLDDATLGKRKRGRKC